jgi:hypothetical protein
VEAHRRQRFAAWALLALTVALIASAAVLTIVNDSITITGDWGTSYLAYPLSLCAVTFPAVGALITIRRPENSLGWLCLCIGVALALTLFAAEYARYGLFTAPGSVPGALFAAWFDNWAWITFVGPLAAILPLLFPDGHLPSPRWRPALVLALLAIGVTGAGGAFDPGPLLNFPGVENPLGVPGSQWLEGAFLLFPVSLLVSSASVVIRFRRATGDERQQIKWFAFAAGALAATFVVVALPLLKGSAARIGGDVVTYMFSGLPIAIGIAILKYRLYDIDRLINRTLVYAAVSLVLGLSYYALIIALPLVFSDERGERPPLFVAATTLAVAALFRPVRARIQDFIDRRFNRRKYDAARTIESFSTRLRDEIDLDALTSHLLGVIHETMEPAHASIWLRGVGQPSAAERSS